MKMAVATKGNSTRRSHPITAPTKAVTGGTSSESADTTLINCHSGTRSRPAVVIFAACDIKAGEELCYDYAFTPESDPTKRLKCCCGAKECRGWMS